MAPTFREVALEWLEKKVPSLSNPKRQHQTITSLEQFISKVGDLAIDKIPLAVRMMHSIAYSPQHRKQKIDAH